MIKTRLSIAFAVMAILAITQGLFSFWATRSAALHAERSVIATSMLKHYLELGANKQRLKVWYAQAALAGDANDETKKMLLDKMSSSLTALQTLAPKNAALKNENENADATTAKNSDAEYVALTLLARNFSVLEQSLAATGAFQALASDPSGRWNELIRLFDRSDDFDMRAVLEESVVRQRATSDEAKLALASVLTQIRAASLLLAFVSTILGVAAVAYFVKRMHQPFVALMQSTAAIAEGNYAYRGRDDAQDEFGQIAKQLNSAAHKLELARSQSLNVRHALDDAIAAKTADVSRSHETLLRIDSRRRQFFAEVSHELRTPVTVIRGEAEIGLRGAHNNTQYYRDALQRIVDASADLSSRVEDLLQLATSDADHYALKLQPTPLSVIIKAALSQMSAIAVNQNITLSPPSHVLSPDVASLVINADKDRLQQALTIVLDNAVRYSQPDGVVTVALNVDTASASVSIIVSDQGIGLTAEELSGAFERHFRGETARKMRPDGAGLGLSIAEAILQAHDGQIMLSKNITSNAANAGIPSGTRATITLPLLPESLFK